MLLEVTEDTVPSRCGFGAGGVAEPSPDPDCAPATDGAACADGADGDALVLDPWLVELPPSSAAAAAAAPPIRTAAVAATMVMPRTETRRGREVSFIRCALSVQVDPIRIVRTGSTHPDRPC